MPQTITIHTAPLPLVPAGILVLYVAEGAAPRGPSGAAWDATGLDFAEIAAAAGFKGTQGQLLDIAAPRGVDARRLFVLGAGRIDPDHPATAAAWTDRGGSLAAKLMAANAETVSVLLDGHEAMPAAVAELAAGLRLRHYRFDKYKSAKPDDATPSAL
ncbi:MAG TPA: M17 family peptidase N-terminal domain-containing protein, partial [Devosia sp.]|nr:M17 family peptidase N-terminal domain-containing protein [Devosia sp.]